MGVLTATLVSPGKYELVEYPLPDPEPGCVLIKMEMSGICGTDKHTYQGYTTQYAGTGSPREIEFPIIQGHENVGTVAAIGGNGYYSDLGGLLVEAGNFSDLGEVSISPHRQICAKNARILGVGGEEPAAYAPSMRQMARYMKQYPLRDFVTHRFPLRGVNAAMEKSIAQDSMKVVMEPWT